MQINTKFEPGDVVNLLGRKRNWRIEEITFSATQKNKVLRYLLWHKKTGVFRSMTDEKALTLVRKGENKTEG